MVKVIAKKNIAFRNPANRDEQVIVRPFEFATLPDWAEQDPMFGWALKDKILEVSKEVISAKEPEKVEVKAEVKKAPAKKALKKAPAKKKE